MTALKVDSFSVNLQMKDMIEKEKISVDVDSFGAYAVHYEQQWLAKLRRQLERQKQETKGDFCATEENRKPLEDWDETDEVFGEELESLKRSDGMQTDNATGLPNTFLELRPFANHCINKYLNIRYNSEASMMLESVPSADDDDSKSVHEAKQVQERALARLSVSLNLSLQLLNLSCRFKCVCLHVSHTVNCALCAAGSQESALHYPCKGSKGNPASCMSSSTLKATNQSS